MTKIIIRIFLFLSHRKPLRFTLLALVTALLCYSGYNVRFKEDISGFLPADYDSERINYAFQNIGSSNNLMVTISMTDTAAATDKELLIEASDSLAGMISMKCSDYVETILHTVDQQEYLDISSFIVRNLPYFLTPEDYERMDTAIVADNVSKELEAGKKWLLSPAGIMMRDNILMDPLHIANPTLSKLKNFQAGSGYKMIDDYIFTKDGHSSLIILNSKYSSSETFQNARFMKLLDSSIADVEKIFNGQISVKYFGATDIAVTNSNRIKTDSILSIIISLVLILVILIYNFRDFKSLLWICISLIFGWLFAIGLISAIRGEVSLIAIGISSIIVGIAINYPLHFLDCYKREPNPRKVLETIVSPLTTGNITTVGAFLSLLFIRSDAMTDLGLFAALFLVGTILFVLIFLPHFVKEKPALSEDGKGTKLLLDINISFGKRYKKWFVWGVVVLTIFLGIMSKDTNFESDMQKINYMTDYQKEQSEIWFKELNNHQQTIYFVSEGQNMEEALSSYETSRPALDSMIACGVLTKISGIGDFLPSKEMQHERLDRWKTFWSHKEDVLSIIDEKAVECGFKAGTFAPYVSNIRQELEVQDIDYFSPVVRSLASNYIIQGKERSMVFNILYTNQTDLDAIEERLGAISPTNFAFDSGTISRTMVSSLSQEFDTVLYICGFIVFFFLLLSMGRIELTLMTFLPLAIGWLWILGIMDIFDIRFNIINIILATLIFGQGDDYSIFMTDGLVYEYTYRKKLLKTYKNSIILSAIVMFVGVGSLIIAKHPALFSLAEVTIIGMVSVVIMTFVFPPIIFRWLTMKKGRKRLMPVTLVNFATTLLAFVFFLVASIIITLCGLLGLGWKSDKHKLLYHKILCGVSRFVIKSIPNVKFKFDNPFGESFEKPSIIISNHQSHLDLMCIMMLNPKIIILTNDWVWHSPFYGILIRYADFYPASKGIDNIMDRLKRMVSKGYSIMIFPEGTRSEDCSIQRFHKGAFYLARELKMDITPVLFHGIGHVLPKSELMLRKGEIHVKVLERIAFKENNSDYVADSKAARLLYIEQYAKYAAQIESPDYFSDRVWHNYVYKGRENELYVRKQLRKNHNFKEIVAKAIEKRNILVKNCGIGELPLMLSLCCTKSRIVATDPSVEKIDLASNCASVPNNLTYLTKDDTFEIENFDFIIDINPITGIITC